MGWKAIKVLGYALGVGMNVQSATGSSPVVYVFRGWKDAVYSVARRSDVERAFGGIETVTELFGGAVFYGSLARAHFVGVWGQRNASRFRRILRERLGSIEIAHARPPALGLGDRITGRRLNRAERERLEARLHVTKVLGQS